MIEPNWAIPFAIGIARFGWMIRAEMGGWAPEVLGRETLFRFGFWFDVRAQGHNTHCPGL